jgi:hypothetical protein
MTPEEKAKAGLWLLKEAIRQYLEQHPEGVPVAKAREDLGLDSADEERKHKGYLFWGLEHVLKDEIGYNKNVNPHLIFLKRNHRMGP